MRYLGVVGAPLIYISLIYIIRDRNARACLLWCIRNICGAHEIFVAVGAAPVCVCVCVFVYVRITHLTFECDHSVAHTRYWWRLVQDRDSFVEIFVLRNIFLCLVQDRESFAEAINQVILLGTAHRSSSPLPLNPKP